MTSLSEHIVPILVTFKGVMVLSIALICYIFNHIKNNINRGIDKLSKKLDILTDMHNDCQKALPTLYAGKGDFDKHKKEIFDALHDHGHSPNGKVIRSR